MLSASHQRRSARSGAPFRPRAILAAARQIEIYQPAPAPLQAIPAARGRVKGYLYLPLALVIFTLGVSTLASAQVGADAPLVYNRDVRPMLSEHCFFCHGQDEATRAAGLRLDTLQGQRQDSVVVPGRPDESELIARIESPDDDVRMPPPDSNHELTAAERQLLRRWIAAGAMFQDHWALEPPVRPAFPAEDSTKSTSRHPIDRFVHASLSSRGIASSPRAERETLIRRVTLDLTGLPPTIAQVDAFLKDSSVDAYEKMVDRLLASPHYGEHLAVSWLDAARYADTHGYQKDNVRTMWAWRDWVIHAFNENMPFDQFTVEQLAGDLLPDATLPQRLATGFNRNHRINAEAGAIDEEYRIENVADRLETTGAIWLGMTIGCARCHDHKFDPISQREYYQMFAFFNNVDEQGVDGVGASAAPSIQWPVPGWEPKIANAREHLRYLRDELDQKSASLTSRKESWQRELRRSLGLDLADDASQPDSRRRQEAQSFWRIVEATEFTSAAGMRFSPLKDRSLLVTGPNPLNDVHRVTMTVEPGHVAAIRLEVFPDPSHTRGGLARSFDGTFVLSGVEFEIVAEDGTSRTVPVDIAFASTHRQGWPISDATDDLSDTGWSVGVHDPWQAVDAVFAFDQPIVCDENQRLRLNLRYESKEEQTMIGRFRLSTTASLEGRGNTMPRVPAALVAALQTDADQRTDAQQALIEDEFRLQEESLAGYIDQITRREQEIDDLQRSSRTRVMVMQERGEPRETFVLMRGMYDQLGEKVTAGVPKVFPPLSPDLPPNRLGFAQWLVDPRHPLTARVTVNRYWQHYFGRGLVKSVEDFGTQGEWPSHLELLDWLAVEFIESGFDVKAMQRLIVTSETYRQTSRATNALREQDLENRWLARGPRFRLTAHMLRDQALSLSGLLQPALGGPPVKPYQPAGLWEGVAGINSNTVSYEQDHGEKLYRRSLYTFWKRAVPPPSMMIFDATNREVCSLRREQTNTPLQALTTLNDVTYVEAARVLAERILESNGLGQLADRDAEVSTPRFSDQALTRRQRLGLLWRLCLARQPSQVELERLGAALTKYQQHFFQHPNAAAKLVRFGESPVRDDVDAVNLAAWTMVASMIMNLDESLTKH